MHKTISQNTGTACPKLEQILSPRSTYYIYNIIAQGLLLLGNIRKKSNYMNVLYQCVGMCECRSLQTWEG